MKFMTAQEIEIAVARWFNPRANLSVPNVSWGLVNHECDLLVLTRSRYLYEVEIKISAGDLRKDLKKRHGHESNLIRHLYFAMPERMIDYTGLVPARAGIILVSESGRCRQIRRPEINAAAKPLSEADRFQFARLGSLRIWPLKSKVMKLKEEATA